MQWPGVEEVMRRLPELTFIILDGTMFDSVHRMGRSEMLRPSGPAISFKTSLGEAYSSSYFQDGDICESIMPGCSKSNEVS